MAYKRLLSFLLIFLFLQQANAQSADSILNFIANHKENSSLYLKKNDTLIASLNENKQMPLASTCKIMVAVEFAKQAAFHVFDPNSKVALKDLDKYYLPLTDGNAHPQWIKYEKDQGNIKNDSVSLLNVARGMIMFSSNANTEYLMDILGLDNINGNYRQMGIKNFTPLYYFVSAIMLYQNPKKIKEEKILKAIKGMSQKDYIKASDLIHQQLKNNPAYKNSFHIADLTTNLQKEWSDRLPASTTESYSRIAEIINDRQIYNAETYAILSRVLETLMENKNNQQWLDHAGMKGGSTMFVLTKTLYATLKSGDKIELSYFFNNLQNNEATTLSKSANAFDLAILSDPAFVKRLSDLIGLSD
ncbi:MAG: serine hydrolase [Chitinophagaceae bacterium]|nr:serine hydrolase [Chitinophagaceae bacterium]